MFLSHPSTSVTQTAHPSTIPLFLETFRYRRFDSHGICASASNRIPFAVEFMSAVFLDNRISRNGWFHSNAIGVFGGYGRDVFR
jgi:hypothetical protein